jgi:flagellar biosynthesis protein
MIRRVNSPEHFRKAVALKYEAPSAPTMVAKGDDDVAEAIIEHAIALGIPISRDSGLVEILSQLEVEEEIPEDLYVAVAVILSWVYWLRGDAPDIGG